MELPIIITSSVIRSSQQGESHGGIYIVNLENEKYRKVIDWNDSRISFEGRGGERGLRGIAFYKDQVYIAAVDQIYVYDTDFKLKNILKNEYLQHCHEICIHKNILYITSTGCNSIILYDLTEKKFITSYFLNDFSYARLYKFARSRLKFFQRLRFLPKVSKFNPNKENEIPKKGPYHMNNVYVNDKGVYTSGTNLGYFIEITKKKCRKIAKISFGTHNVMPYKKGVIYNNTNNGSVTYQDLENHDTYHFKVKKFDNSKLLNSDLPLKVARPYFCRGLCTAPNGIIIGGSSPATISVYKFFDPKPIKIVNLTMDVRNAIHGLEIWPYSNNII